MSRAVALPETIKVLERGRLSANNVLLRSHDGTALVDELARGRAARREDGKIVPLVTA